MNIENEYKYNEIKEYFNDSLEDYDKKTLDKLVRDNELHHEIFNTDYYIIGRYQAIKWLSDEVFNVINFIKEYENNNFGEVNTDFSEPEKIVNMYVYIVGEEIANDYINSLEVKSA
jgi:ATP-dependent protease Clp ATPase subunit